jgi:hypothetical protein
VGNPRQAVRESKPPERFCGYIAMVSNIRESEPSTFEEVVGRQVWIDAMMEEYSSIMKNDVWEIIPRPEGKLVVTSRWLYKLKYVADGNIEKYKARFVVRGFSQVEGFDYDETFASVARYTSIRAVISIATEMGWKIHQMDVKTTFLNGLIQEEVYIEQPLGFEVHGMSGTSLPSPSPQYHDVMLKSGTFFPSWENCLASNGWVRLSKSSSRPSKSSLFHLACGPLASNLWACSPMEAQARLVLPKMSTS